MDLLLQGIWYAAETFFSAKSYLETLSGKLSSLKSEAREKMLDESNEEFASARENASKIASAVQDAVKDITGPTAVILEALLEDVFGLVSDNANAALTETSDTLAKAAFSHGTKEDARARMKEAKTVYETMADAYKILPGQDKVTIPELPKTGGGRPVGSKNTNLTVGEYYFTLNGDKSPITTPSQFVYQATKECGGSNKNGSYSMVEFTGLLREAGITDWTQSNWELRVSDTVTIGFVRN